MGAYAIIRRYFSLQCSVSLHVNVNIAFCSENHANTKYITDVRCARNIDTKPSSALEVLCFLSRHFEQMRMPGILTATTEMLENI